MKKKQFFSNVMKLFCFILMNVVLHANATPESRILNLDVHLENVTVKVVLKIIEAESEYRFFYSDDLSFINEKISLNLKNMPVEEILDNIFDKSDLTYRIFSNNLIVVTPAGELMQSITITGKVTDEEGIPLAGVTIFVKNTQNGAMTDPDGIFTISVANEQAVLTFSYIGFVTQEVPVRNQTTINISLIEDTKLLDEVVVVGYGTRVRGQLTGSIVKTDSKAFETRPIVGAVNALQGAMPGVTVIRGTTRPGYDQNEFLIRGFSSLNGADPLILIDGVAGDLNLMNPADIEDVTVLKDASASIYGARASGGVIIVTTKRGKAGKPKLSYSTNFGVKIPHFLKDMATTSQMIDMYQEAKTNMGRILASQEVVDKIKAGNTPPDPNGGWLEGYTAYPGFYGYYDWNDMVIGNGTQQNHNVSISGGSDNSTYLFSTGYNRDEGFFKFGDPSVANRYNLSLNNNFRNIFNRLNIESRVQFDSRRTSEPTGTSTTLEHLAKLWRFLPPYNDEGNYYMWEGFQNPINILENGGNRYIRRDQITLNFKGELNLIEGLKLTGQYAMRMSQGDTKVENRTYYHYDWNNRLHRTDVYPNSVSYSPSYTRFSSYTAYLDYNKSFGKHNLNFMVGSQHEEQYNESKSLSGSNLDSNDLFTLNLSDKTDIRYLSATSTESDWALTSFFGRIGYNYNSRYMVDFTLRADGSSRFAPSKRWSALFPAVSAGWNVGNEEFISSLNFFDQLKLRLSWGQSGNQTGIGNYDFIPLISRSTNGYPFGIPGVASTTATSQIASQSRTWETVTVLNAGLDFSVLRSRLSGSFEVYKKINSDMLVTQDLPALLGGSAPSQNLGELETKGFDLSIGWRDRINDFSYGITFILSDSDNKLISLKGSNRKAEGLVTASEGYPMNSYYGYISEGIIKTEEQLEEYKKLGGTVPAGLSVGDMMYRDVDGDGQITAFGADGESGDLVYIGNRMPRYTYSSNINLSYKNIDFTLFLQGVGKRNVVRTGDFQSPFRYYWFQPLAYYYEKTWTVDRPNAEIPRIIEGSRGMDAVYNWNYRYSDAPHRLIDASYLRIKVITLAYRVPQSVCNNLKIQSIRVYASGEDLFTFAKGTWGGTFDPEEGWQNTDAFTFPFNKTISFGIDVKF